VVGPQAVQIAFGPGGLLCCGCWRRALPGWPCGGSSRPLQPVHLAHRIAGAAVLLQWKISVRESPAAPRPSPAIAAVSAGRHGSGQGGRPQPEPELPASA